VAYFLEFLIHPAKKVERFEFNILCDETGRVVYENQSIDYRNVLDLKSLAAGVYFLNISAGKEKAGFKIVKLNW
jgi:hypothetical protein